MDQLFIFILSVYLLFYLYVGSNPDLFSVDNYLAGLSIVSSICFTGISALSNVENPLQYQRGFLIWVFILILGSFNTMALNYFIGWNDNVYFDSIIVSMVSMILYCYVAVIEKFLN